MPHRTPSVDPVKRSSNGHSEKQQLQELVEAQQKCVLALRQAIEQFGEYLRKFGAGGRDSFGQDIAGMQYVLHLFYGYLEGQLPDPW